MKTASAPLIDVSIECNGTILQEYEHEDDDAGDDASKCVKYVEASSGSTFAVVLESRYNMHRAWPNITADIKLDGHIMARPVVKIEGGYVRHTLKGHNAVIAGRPVIQRFKFSDLATNDGPVGKAKASDFQGLGEVQMDIYRCIVSSRTTSRTAPIPNTPQAAVPEKCLKGRAISNRASLGAPEPSHKVGDSCQVVYENEKAPLATYIFKYRSRRDLQIEGIIERSPSPVPLEERDPETLSVEEARELVRRMRAQPTETKVKIKTEKRARDAYEDEEGEDGDEVEVMEHRSTKRARFSTDSGVEIVDLTGD